MILKYKSRGAAPINPINPAIIEPVIVPEIMEKEYSELQASLAVHRGRKQIAVITSNNPTIIGMKVGKAGKMPNPRSTSPYKVIAHKHPIIASIQ